MEWQGRIIKIGAPVSKAEGNIERYVAGTAIQNYYGCDACESYPSSNADGKGTWVEQAAKWVGQGIGNANKSIEQKRAADAYAKKKAADVELINAKSKVALAKESTKSDTALAKAVGGGSAAPASTGLSTGAKVGIGVGIAAVLGTIIYLVVRKKK